ncbi:NUDIX domain-containing protein [Mycoplasma todarodis]|uniref:Nudix hydrolase domain-containing protein n=1 Tax=Mycoplasma todarodis TaxID=1937191 RepID=A0A4R0XT37_9MOLU|nr:NUDIX domain-containing protein [Mycoplasma todarodis]TCG10779.1 hypothetical protein C4B25_03080 [Mycoplasma todarodis]
MQNTKDYVMDIRKKLNTHDEIMVPSAAIIPFKDSKIMLQLRSDSNQWGLIGGGINYGELITNTAIRELKEETNLDAINYDLLGIYSQFNIEYANQDKVNAFTVAFVCEVTNEKESKFNDGETLDVKWFTIEEIRKLNLWHEKVLEISEDAFEFLNNKKVVVK